LLHHLFPAPPADLQPVISSETISFHPAKHDAAYVARLNEFAGSNEAMAGMSLEQVIKERLDWSCASARFEQTAG